MTRLTQAVEADTGSRGLAYGFTDKAADFPSRGCCPLLVKEAGNPSADLGLFPSFSFLLTPASLALSSMSP